MTTQTEILANTIRRVLESPNEPDRNMEPANIVDGLFALARAVHTLAKAIESQTSEGADE